MIGPVLTGAAITLRPLEESDATDAYVGWLNDHDVNQYLEARFAPPSSRQDLEIYIRGVREHPSTYAFAIVQRSDCSSFSGGDADTRALAEATMRARV